MLITRDPSGRLERSIIPVTPRDRKPSKITKYQTSRVPTIVQTETPVERMNGRLLSEVTRNYYDHKESKDVTTAGDPEKYVH